MISRLSQTLGGQELNQGSVNPPDNDISNVGFCFPGIKRELVFKRFPLPPAHNSLRTEVLNYANEGKNVFRLVYSKCYKLGRENILN